MKTGCFFSYGSALTVSITASWGLAHRLYVTNQGWDLLPSDPLIVTMLLAIMLASSSTRADVALEEDTVNATRIPAFKCWHMLAGHDKRSDATQVFPSVSMNASTAKDAVAGHAVSCR